MSNLSTIDQYYVPEIINLLNPIVFDTGTLGSLNLITNYDQAKKDTPYTQINVFGAGLSSNYFESKLSKRKYNVKIKIYCYTVGERTVPRLLQAEQDLNYLEEQIITLLENNLETIIADPVNSFSYSANDAIVSNEKRFADNYYIKEIMWPVFKQVVVNN